MRVLMEELKKVIEAIVDDANLEPSTERHLIENLEKHLRPYFEAVKAHHDAHADDLCVLDDDELYKKFGLPPRDNSVGDTKAMLANCERFLKQRCKPGGGWISYKELEEQLVDIHKLLSNALRNNSVNSPFDLVINSWLSKNDDFYMKVRHG
jgi:hypothetical protein